MQQAIKQPTDNHRGSEKYTLAGIFREYLPIYAQTHKLSPKQSKVSNAIINCRTSFLGGHMYKCTDCGHKHPCYNPCRDRHCPNCQYILKEKWVQARLKELLEVPYYHVVFTLPHALNDLISYNKRKLYNLFFLCVKETMATFAKDEKYLGGQTGYIALLHTWGQTCAQHVHLHLIVAGGALSADKGSWLRLPYESKFLFPVRAVGKMFRGKFISKLKKMQHKGELVVPDSLECFKQPHVFDHMLDSIAHKKWRVFSKKPFAGPEEVVKYIGRYTHRVAISNRRILDVENGKVTFSYKDYKGHANGGQLWRTMELSTHEFIRRFMLHILPQGFNKIRFYGFWAINVKKKTLPLIRSLLAKEGQPSEGTGEEEKEKEETAAIIHYICPKCGKEMAYWAQIEAQKYVPFANSS